MSLDKTAEAIIRDAMARGDFDNLPGKGKPLDLTAYFETSEDVRMAFSLLKNAGMVPEEIELLQELETMRETLQEITGEDERRDLRRKISEKQMHFNLLMERRKGQP